MSDPVTNDRNVRALQQELQLQRDQFSAQALQLQALQAQVTSLTALCAQLQRQIGQLAGRLRGSTHDDR